jgi:ACS family hexuronate transporter-like MFS transporter
LGWRFSSKKVHAVGEVPQIENPTGLPPGVNPWRARIVLLSLVHAVGTACYLSIMAMGPIIREDLEITAAQFGFFMSAVFGAQLFSALPSGVVTDRMGVGWTLFGAMLLMFAGTLLFSVAEDFEAALVAAFLIGLGYSFVNPATAKGVVRWFPAQWRGTAMGLKQLGVPLGGVIGAGGGVLAAFMDWQHVLWIAAAMTFVGALLWLPLTRKPTWGVGGMRAIFRDLKSVLTNRNMNVICGSCILLNTGQSSLFSYTALFLKDAAQTSQPVAAMGVAFAQGASAFGRVGFSYLSDTVFGGRRKGVVAGIIAIGVIACGVAYFVNPSWPHWGLMALVTVMGGTMASYAALILAMTAESVPENLVGSAIGYNGMAWSIGGMIGPPLFGKILDMTGNQYGISWIVVAVLMLIGAMTLMVFAREKT